MGAGQPERPEAGQEHGWISNQPRSIRQKAAYLKQQRAVKRSTAGMLPSQVQHQPADTNAYFHLNGYTSSNLVSQSSRADIKSRVLEQAWGVKRQEDLQTVFHVREADWEIEKRVVASQQPLATLPHSWRFLGEEFYPSNVDMPKRPAWDRSMKKKLVEAREQAYFEDWLGQVYKRHQIADLNYFEHNLAVWRQLWRVVEQSTVLVRERLTPSCATPVICF